MKLSNVLKTVGAAALLSSLIPYRVTTDEDTGEKKYRALLWEATWVPQDEDSTGKSLSVHVGFNNPLEDSEAHMYADDLAVEYTDEEEEFAEELEDTEEETAEAEETAEESEDAGEPVLETAEVPAEEPAEESAEEPAAAEEPAVETVEPAPEVAEEAGEEEASSEEA